MGIYIIRVASGHDWLVEAESEEEALRNWPEDAEEANEADVPTVSEALSVHSSGESDVDDAALLEWVFRHSQWRHSPATIVELVADDEVLATGLVVDGELDTERCSVMQVLSGIASEDDIDWERGAMARRTE